MSLAWSFASLKTPYGDVTTAHWAVPDEEANAASGASQQQKSLLEKAEFQLETAEDELGAVYWNSNTVAAKFLHDHFNSKTGKNVIKNSDRKILELGAGVGCLGIALALGGMDVCVTDIPRVLPLMKVNVDLNKQKLATASVPPGKCFASSLAWEAKTLDKQFEEWWFENNNNNNNNKQKQPKRTIVMVDALYGNPKGWPPLIRLLEKLLAVDEDCEVINFCEQRVVGVEDGFLKLLGEENEKKNKAAENEDDKEGKVWVWDLQELEEKSEMGMTVRRTIIKFVKRPRGKNGDKEKKELGSRRERGE